jgi:hypothetical protein
MTVTTRSHTPGPFGLLSQVTVLLPELVFLPLADGARGHLAVLRRSHGTGLPAVNAAATLAASAVSSAARDVTAS